jgi:hypothetical protein
MNRIKGIILCEGETDQVLMSAYLGKVRGWEYFRNRNSPLPQEPIRWFKNERDDLLGFWLVGGSSFAGPIKKLLKWMRYESESTIESIVVVTDHDDSAAEHDRLRDLLDAIDDALSTSDDSPDILPNRWHSLKLASRFPGAKDLEVRIAYLLVPMNEYGALETFMLDALAEGSQEKEHVIEQSRSFVEEFESNVYLKRRRERTKAELGVALSVFSPDRVFTTMQELIDSVDWSEFEATDEQFKLLTDI